jgi:hypothetical protein
MRHDVAIGVPGQSTLTGPGQAGQRKRAPDFEGMDVDADPDPRGAVEGLLERNDLVGSH